MAILINAAISMEGEKMKIGIGYENSLSAHSAGRNVARMAI
jgi:hypothetical protein